ncbi:hypothetical protein SDC9_03477 [bioreactor metagenome]|uniref:Transglutaminase-like domain-containing protein n=1 Tax=bioreactor metagenome TaxID=1076179 RepID=A0A644STL5_9ZZZZ|nr:transglutaminase domain-containing protein [Methanobrevibacter sp.]MEA4956099.1 transglutaminase domain-containing protein [Methanobrevibacter sp.]
MKFIKKKFLVFILLIFFMTLLSLTAVSAADYTVTGNSYDDIQNSVDVAGNNDRLLIGTGTYSSSGNAIEIDGKNITIQGQSNSNRAKLDGRGLYRTIIVQEDASLTLRYIDFVNGTSISYHTLNIRGSILVESCSFKNCYGDSGSAIYVFEDSNSAIIKDCTFINNHAANTGDNSYTVGGAVISQGSANFKVINCYFENNTALTYGGAIGLRNNGVGAEITNCTFVNNFAPDGGAIYALASATILGSTFRNNRATNNGGAIVTTGSNSLNIANSKFESNRAKNGGALYLTVLTRIIGSSFSSNSATGNGGGLYTTGSSRSIISSSKFTSNSAKYGGGIYNNASLSISSSNFVSNKASANGGAIYANKNLNISGGNIKSNNANYGSGIYNVATLRLVKLPSLSKNSENPIAILLNVKSTVKPGTTLNIQASLKKKNNVKGINGIYSTNTNVFKGNTRITIFNYFSNQNLYFTISGKTYKKNSGKTGIAKYSLKTANKNNYKIKITVKTSHSKKTFKKSSTVTVKKDTGIGKRAGISSSNSNQKVEISSEDMLYINATYNTKNIKKINSKTISYYNVKKSNNIVDKYYYRVKSDGWYIGKKKNNEKLIWNRTSKPSSSGNWYNVSIDKNDKPKILDRTSPFTSNKSKMTLFYFVVVSKSKTSADLKPYVLNSYKITKTDGTTRLVGIYETATSDIYFSSLGFNSSKLENELNYKNQYVQVNHPDIKKLVINIFQGKTGYGKGIEGELTATAKINATYKWIAVTKKIGYKYYRNFHYSATGVLWRLMKKSNGHANCADQSTFLITILRTAGVPAKFQNNNALGGHIVVKAYYTNTKIYTLDTTSSKNSVGVINSWNPKKVKVHATSYILEYYPHSKPFPRNKTITCCK